MANSVDPCQFEQSDLGPPCLPNITDEILKFVSNVRQSVAADGFSRRHFSDVFFLGALKVKSFLGHRVDGFVVIINVKYIKFMRGSRKFCQRRSNTDVCLVVFV